MPENLLTKMTGLAEGAALPAPVDARGTLATNPNGRRWRTRDVQALKGLVWHQELGWGSVEAVARYHTGPNSHLADGGVESISYTWAVRRDGQVVLCNDLEKAPWSQGFKGRPGDENREFMSAMFEGFFNAPGVTDPTAGEPTEAQILAGLLLWRASKEQWGWNEDDLFGHYHFGKPACPGTTLQTVIESIRANVQQPKNEFNSVEGRQRALQALGFLEGPLDGIWGPDARGALTRFQEIAGLVADGIWGAKTEAAITNALVNPPDFSSDEARQEALKTLGFYSGAVDGIWGAGSKAALEKFQRDAGLQPDGIWGPKSEEALRKAILSKQVG